MITFDFFIFVPQKYFRLSLLFTPAPMPWELTCCTKTELQFLVEIKLFNYSSIPGGMSSYFTNVFLAFSLLFLNITQCDSVRRTYNISRRRRKSDKKKCLLTVVSLFFRNFFSTVTQTHTHSWWMEGDLGCEQLIMRLISNDIDRLTRAFVKRENL